MPDDGRVRSRLLPLLTVTAVLTAGLALPRPAVAEGPQLSAVLSLTPAAGAAGRLHRLAAGRARPAALQALAPAPRHRAAALAFARHAHLQVLRADPWTVTLRGPAAAMAQAFGTALRHAHGSTWAARPAVPAALRGDVDGVAGLDDRPAHRRHATLDGADNPQTPASLRAAYGLPSDPAWQGRGLTVGILNLSGWNAGDLAVFAKANGIALRPDQVTAVDDMGLPASRLDGTGGEYEAALDAEAALAMAPAANLRMYFAPNTTAGVLTAISRMAADAQAGTLQVATTSWGSCERDAEASETAQDRAAYTEGIDRMVAAGATLFAASGDSGAFDCGYPDTPDGSAQVDFPASYGNTVAVGGTTLTAGQPETGWYDLGFDTYLGNGSGGGESLEQAQPRYQAGLVPGTTHRLVPDVAADADPQSGLRVYVSTGGGWSAAGGTSLAAPLWAGMLASALSAASRTSGLGNVLPALYAQAGSPGLRDVTAGHNGLFHAGVGYDEVTGLGVPEWSLLGPALLRNDPPPAPATPSDPVVRQRPSALADPVLRVPSYVRSTRVPLVVTAPDGYTGFAVGESVPACADLGASVPSSATLDPGAWQGEHEIVLTALDASQTCHVTPGLLVYDSGAPSTTLAVAVSGDGLRIVVGGYDETSGMGSWTVTVRDGSAVLLRALTYRRTLTPALAAGHTYTVEAIARDRAGNAGPLVRATVKLPLDDTAYATTGSWTRVTRAASYRGSHLQTAVRGFAARLTVTGRAVDALVLRGPGSGYADLYVDGHRVRRLDLFAPATQAVHLRLGQWSAAGRHTVQLVVVGAHRSGSRGSYVVLDGASVFP
jgi:hypothetical protein